MFTSAGQKSVMVLSVCQCPVGSCFNSAPTSSTLVTLSNVTGHIALPNNELAWMGSVAFHSVDNLCRILPLITGCVVPIIM